jgi:hypothetical protein
MDLGKVMCAKLKFNFNFFYNALYLALYSFKIGYIIGIKNPLNRISTTPIVSPKKGPMAKIFSLFGAIGS